MSKKDYELIARTIRELDQLGAAAHRYVAEAFADELATTNPRFARERFIAACMGEDSHDSAGRRVRYSA